MEQILQTQAAAARPEQNPGAELSPSLLAESITTVGSHLFHGKVWSTFCSLLVHLTQQGSHLAPKCLSDLGKVLILILFLLFAGLCSHGGDSISPANALGHVWG